MLTRLIRRFAVVLLTLALVALCAACAGLGSDAGIEAAADKTAITLYRDDTLVTYTVIVPRRCNMVSIQIPDNRTGMDGKPVVLEEYSFSREVVTVVENGARDMWIIPFDFGIRGMDGVRVQAQLPMGKKLTATIAITASYPVYSADSLLEAYQNFVCLGGDAPYYFVCLPEDEATVKAGIAALRGENAADDGILQLVVTGGDFVYPAAAEPIIRTASRSDEMGMLVPEGYVLCSIYVPNDDFTLCYAGKGLRVTDSARVIIAEKAGVDIDPQDYPVAALIQRRVRTLLDDWDAWEGVSPYDTVTWAYNRIYNEGRMALDLYGAETYSEAELAYFWDTAYGLYANCGSRSGGYADALYVFANLLGIPCVKLPCQIIGEAGEGCVNAVLLDGEWYLIDVYSAAKNPLPGQDMYARFCLNAGQASAFYVLHAPGLTLTSSTRYSAAGEP